METLVQSELKTGDDVLVTGAVETIFHKKDGTIKGTTPEGKIVVHFHKKFSYIFGFEYNQGKTTREFDPQDLQKINLDEHPKIKADRFFAGFYHKLSTRTYKFSPENHCMMQGCHAKAHRRILVNIWGCLCEYDVCEKHASFDGTAGEGFTFKARYRIQVKEPL